MNTKSPPPFLAIILTSILLAFIGFGGLAWLFLDTLPTLGYRWLFFFFATLAASGIFLPVVYFLSRRFPSTPPSDGQVIIRQSTWFGVYVGILAWLQLGRVLTLPIAIFIAAGLIIIELLLRMWEKSRWQPPEETPDA